MKTQTSTCPVLLADIVDRVAVRLKQGAIPRDEVGALFSKMDAKERQLLASSPFLTEADVEANATKHGIEGRDILYILNPLINQCTFTDASSPYPVCAASVHTKTLDSQAGRK